MAAFWLIGTAQIICIVSYPRKRSKFLLFCMWSVKGLYLALIPKTDDRDKGRGHDRRLLVALFSHQYQGKSQWRARCPAKWWEHSPVPPSECDLSFKFRHECHYVGEFVVSSLPCSEWFSPGTPGFPSLQKQTLPISNSIWNALTSLKQFLRTPTLYM